MSYAQPRQNSTRQGRGVPDGVLVGQAQGGDQGAFELLTSRYHRLLASYIRGFLKDGDQVSDVLQQVYLQLYLSLPVLLTNVSLKGWLLQVARNRCLDELRHRSRQAAVPFSALEWEHGEEEQAKIATIPDSDPPPEEVVEMSERYGSLRQAIAALPPKFRSIVLLHCFRQLTFTEIGRMLDMPASTAKTYYYRALPQLRRTLVGEAHFAAVS